MRCYEYHWPYRTHVWSLASIDTYQQKESWEWQNFWFRQSMTTQNTCSNNNSSNIDGLLTENNKNNIIVCNQTLCLRLESAAVALWSVMMPVRSVTVALGNLFWFEGWNVNRITNNNMWSTHSLTLLLWVFYLVWRRLLLIERMLPECENWLCSICIDRRFEWKWIWRKGVSASVKLHAFWTRDVDK